MDKSVEAYELLADGRLIGLFYLYMHPRKDKYNHAAEFPIAPASPAGRSPRRLWLHLPGGGAGDPA